MGDKLKGYRGRKVTKSKPMTGADKARIAAARERKREAAERRRRKLEAERSRNGDGATWRDIVLRRYINRVLALEGGERLAFMETNPVSRIFD